MRDIPASMIIDSVDSGVGARLDLFELDLQPFGGDVLRFHSGTNGIGTAVIWKGLAYQPYPIGVSGFDMKNEGAYARPIMTVSNVTGLITGVNHDFDDIIGVALTRRQVDVKYLDAVNFPNGNTSADSTKEAVSRFIVQSMNGEDEETVTYSLATPVDNDKAVAPARTILADVCQWRYRGAGCGYSGGAVADEKDNPTSDINKDRCSHRRSGCRMRFPRPDILPIGTFPGSQKVN
ncbi:tail protein [bacteria symbiont BFo2 of Frankliniella occidentalis]|nr:tail protein [bacteria symbiont BFo2 of Frankliniella occidentalis]KYP87101.1 tail protein [bacteria symbiont BFo2 of Frankliniella occidentalis]KYP94527.1 tail protein [bacteria symbiont BFo2 of Frankliniella occidentalis]